MRTLSHALAGLAAACVLLSIGIEPAPAATTSSHSVQVRRTASFLWIETSLPRTEARRVKFTVLAPTGNGGRRELWQFCRIDYVGLGTYRCGVDFARASGARRARGDWAARLHIDGNLVARKLFKVPEQ